MTVLGRRHGAVRKGGRWVAPAEVESVLREHPQVRDVHVRARRGRFADEDSLYNPRLKRRYAIRDDIPVMLIDEAETVADDEHKRIMAKVEAEGLKPTFDADA